MFTNLHVEFWSGWACNVRLGGVPNLGLWPLPALGEAGLGGTRTDSFGVFFWMKERKEKKKKSRTRSQTVGNQLFYKSDKPGNVERLIIFYYLYNRLLFSLHITRLHNCPRSWWVEKKDGNITQYHCLCSNIPFNRKCDLMDLHLVFLFAPLLFPQLSSLPDAKLKQQQQNVSHSWQLGLCVIKHVISQHKSKVLAKSFI